MSYVTDYTGELPANKITDETLADPSSLPPLNVEYISWYQNNIGSTP